jgi:predicted ATPase
VLLRLSVTGFKNLHETTILFGPFTCIAGANGAGKSNVYDAIMFLHDLADLPIIEAATRVRDRTGKQKGDIRSLFTVGSKGHLNEMSIETEFLVAKTVVDDFGQEGKPSSTHLKYRVQFRYIESSGATQERLELTHESLTYVEKTESKDRIGFRTSQDFWQSIIGAPRRVPFISTDTSGEVPVIRLSQEGVPGRPSHIPALSSPRTVLGSINTVDRPTALAARRELQSWSILQLEPSNLRLPDEFSDEAQVSSAGAHLPATLHRLGKFEEVASRLSDLLPDISTVGVDIDEARRLKTLFVKNREGVKHTARFLSDGTLRFLALAIIGADLHSGRVVCLEEPENGIHPSRVGAILGLLRSIPVNPLKPVSDTNPLRQVVISTHSPLVVQHVDTQDLLVALPYRKEGALITSFGAIAQTWRTREKTGAAAQPIPLGTLLDFLTKEFDQAKGEKLAVESESVLQFAKKQGVFDFMVDSLL